MDIFAPGIVLGQAIGRLGCFAAGCCWGRECDLPWGVRFRSNFDRDKWDQAALEHREMVDSLEAHDGPRLAAILRAHLKQKGDAVREALRTSAAAPTPSR